MLLISLGIIKSDFIEATYDESSDLLHCQADCAIEILINHSWPEAVLIAPGPDIEWFLIGLVSDTISDFRTKHHLVAAHEIVYNIFQLWLKCTGIDQINKDFLVRAYLDTLVSFDEVDKASNVEGPVYLPSFLKGKFIRDLLEEEDLTWWTSNEGFTIHQVHLA